MNGPDLPIHWQFASGQAFAGLRGLVCAFDFLRDANGHTYVGIEPGYLIDVIDGFLGEPDAVVFGGDRSTLQDLRKLLIEKVQPAHRDGLEAGRRRWHEGNRAYGSLSTEELHRLALELAPADDMLRGWFAEGFCFAYSFEEMESLRSQAKGLANG
jgi:hypothetical protein